jgi:hypothetical protein
MAARLEALGEISKILTGNKIEIAGVKSQRLDKRRYEIELDLRPPAGTKDDSIVAAVLSVSGVEILEAGSPTE